MRGQYDLCITSANISQTRAILPRLDYSGKLISQSIKTLRQKRAELKKSNRVFLIDENDEQNCVRAIDLERTVSFCLESLYCIEKKINSASRIDAIPKTFPSLVPVIRTISAKLIDILPEVSLHLSELSVHLGSIVLDSASITKAQFDFSQSNMESSILLDEVKLIVDSKICKQYPHLDFLTVFDN